MSYSYRFITLLNFVLTFFASIPLYAHEVFAEALYWRSTESVDWAYVNDRHLPNQQITYRTIDFHFEPNFRLGVASKGNYNFNFYYTRFHTHADDSVFGNITSAFISDRIANFPNGYLYQAGEIDFTIDFNMFDANLSESFYVTDTFILSPVIGLRGGWINQSINSNFQGPVSAIENIKNNFWGIGPKTSLETELVLVCTRSYEFDFFADFTAAYLWGHWNVKDTYFDSVPHNVDVIISSKNFGAVALEANLGFKLNYKNFSVKLAYEIIDWFNQCLIYDNDSGPNNEDLFLQGFSFGVRFLF